VVIRGGGARNELAAFDAEVIARSIAASPLPVFTGLGHETDRAVADEVAHTSLKTPTACAGALIGLVGHYVGAAEQRWSAIEQRSREALNEASADLTVRTTRVSRHTVHAIDRAEERLAMRVNRLVSHTPLALQRADRRVSEISSTLRSRSAHRLERELGRLDLAAARLSAVDPAVQLARGWTITRTADGTLVRSVTDAPPGTGMVTTTVDGTLVSQVSASSVSAPPASPPAVPPAIPSPRIPPSPTAAEPAPRAHGGLSDA
jgi:exodeoxyribonuclease VII large subunit